MSMTEDLRAWVQDAIDKGATSVEDVHRQIAALPLNTLKSVPGLQGFAGTAEELTNASIGAVYDAIRNVNDQVNDIARQLLANVRAPEAGR